MNSKATLIEQLIHDCLTTLNAADYITIRTSLPDRVLVADCIYADSRLFNLVGLEKMHG